MKKIIALLLAVMMVLAMAACAAKTTDTPAPAETDNKTDAVQETATEAAADGKTELNIGVLVWKYSDTYGSSVRVAMDKYAKEIGAEKGLTINLEMQDGNDDQATQNNQADVMFAAGKDHIIINLCDTSAGQYLVDLAKQYNVPISFYNKEPVDSTIVTGSNSIFVGTSHDEAGIIYISHKMDEIKRISDEVTIMRDGQWISTDKTENLSTDDIIKRMVNREMTNRFPAKDNVPGDVLMEVSHLTGKYMPTCQDVSFELRAGEVLGVAGLVGSRRTELLSTIFGIMSRESGEIKLNGKPISNKTPRQSIKNGFAMLTEERRATGIFPYASILFNTVISNLGSYKKGPLLSDKKMTADTDWSISSMHIKTPSQKTLIKNLSGGNQQKVILGRWLLTKPDVLLLDEPTRGIDVGAKYEIYELILQLAKQGKAVMMVSSEMPELIGICDRILVMSNGHMAGILERGKDFGGVENEQETIMRLAAQYV